MTLSTRKQAFMPLKIDFEDDSEKTYLTMEDGTQILAMHTYPNKEYHNGFTLMLIAGWGSIPPGWKDFIEEAKKDFNFIYLETREKDSSIFPKKPQRGGITLLSSDLASVISQLNLDQNKLLLFGSCMGANLIADGLAKDKFNPLISFLAGPQPEWPLPRGARTLMGLGTRHTLTPIRPILRFWIKNTLKNSPEAAAKYVRVINEASPLKWWWIGKPIALEKYMPLYEKIRKPVVIIAEEGDEMHLPEETKEIARSIPDSVLISMPSNLATHSDLMIRRIREFLKIPSP
jgi:pimeloyl-ACP methyl ester carboxylesterase